MQRIVVLFISFLLIVVFEIWTLQPLFSQETTLEEYSVSHGGTSETNSSGFLPNCLINTLETVQQVHPLDLK